MDKTKPCGMAKRDVWEADKQVKAHHGAAGIDRQSIEPFDQELENTLYRLWNRLSSGRYFPSPVRGWTDRRTSSAPGREAFPRLALASPRWWSNDTWSRFWNHESMPTRRGLAPAGQRSRPCR